MEELEVVVESGLYSADVVTRAAHRQSDLCHVSVRGGSGSLVIVLRPKEACSLDALEARVWADLLDERLRERVAEQTGALKEILLSAALREARGSSK